MTSAGGAEGAPDEREDLLALCTEEGRLKRAHSESGRVSLQLDGPELFMAAASKYNVVIDLGSRRVQHGCRDFLGQGREGKLCKHVAAVLLAIDEQAALTVLRGLTEPRGDWALEVIAARGFGRG